MNMQNRVQKLITFSPNLFVMIENKAEKLGVSFPEYIRMLAVSDIKKQVEDFPLVNEKTEQLIAKSLQDIKHGRYTRLGTDKEIDKHFDNL